MSLRTQALVALTTLCVIAVGAAAVLLFPRGPSYGPADLLPAEHTLILIQNIQPDIREVLGKMIPALQTIPPTPGSTAALMRLPDGSTDWIVFSQTQNQTEPGIQAQNPKSFDLIRTGTPLGEEPAFRTLMRSVNGRSRLYVNAHKLQTSFPAPVLAPTGPMAIGMDAQEMEFARITHTRAGDALSSGIRPFFVNPLMTLQAADFRTFISTAAGDIQSDRALAYAGRIKAWFNQTFGTDLSFQYDFMPLLTSQTTLALGRTAGSGGSLIAVLEGSGEGDVEQRLAALHQGFHGAVAGIARVQRTFDEKFTYDNMRVDGSSVAVTEEETGGWSVRISSNGTKTFATATNGHRFMMSNNAPALRSAIGAYPPPLQGQAPVAQGSIDSVSGRALLQSWLGGEDLLAQLPGTQKAVLHWQVLRSGNVTLLRLF